MTRPLIMVVAKGRNNAIGSRNHLPWRLPSDLRHFRALTMGKPVIMGRKTYESIGRPLPGRHLVVLSGNPEYVAPAGVEIARTPDEAVARAEALAEEHEAGEVVVAGGATLYEALLDEARRLHVTEVDLAPEADAFFPPIDLAVWRQASRLPQTQAANDEAAFAFVTYERL